MRNAVKKRFGWRGELYSKLNCPITSLNQKIKKTNGFTLSETLITLLIIGILAALTLPVVQKDHPDKLEAMRRKCYYILENTVSQMYNDDILYRKRIDGSDTGFRNIEKINYNGKIYEGETKFCEFFANSLTKRANTKVNCSVDAKTFTSSDNVDWYLPVTDFKDGYAVIKFDVNGKEEPNCEYNSKTCTKPDTFKYYITNKGKLSEDVPTINKLTYCIRTAITGEGDVNPSKEYCGLENGTYILTSLPKRGWVSNWANNEKKIKIKNNNVNTSVLFTELPKACVNLEVNCESGAPSQCAFNYLITNGNFTTNGNILSSCNLPAGEYKIIVSPFDSHYSSWRTKTVYLNGVDQNLSVNLNEYTYCVFLNVDCPDGGANVCGTYDAVGNNKSYSLSSSDNSASLCTFKNGNYTLTVTPKMGYLIDEPTQNFRIADSSWQGDVKFTKKLANCKEDGYFEAGGKKWSCPFYPTPVTKAECDEMKAKGEIFSSCYNEKAYWAGAVKRCGGKNKMPSKSDLAKIASEIYEGNPSIIPTGTTNNLKYNINNGKGLPEPYFEVFNNEEPGAMDGCFRRFNKTYTGTYCISSASAYGIYAVCQVE